MNTRGLNSPSSLGRAAVLLSTTVALAACATMSRPERDSYTQAKNEVQQLEARPLASEAAGMPLQRARQDLANADDAASHHRADGVMYWSYLAQREAETGEAMVDEQQARNQIASATAEREHMLMAYQRRRAEIAQQHAEVAEQRATQAEAALQQLQQQNAQAQQQTQIDQARQEAAQAQQAAEQARQQAAQDSAQAQQQVAQAQQQADQARQREEEARRELAGLQARQTNEGMLLTLNSSLLFATNRDVLEPGALPTISSVAAFLQQHPMVQIRIEGFTDNRGSDQLNDALSQRRAQSVANALVADGVDPSRFKVVGRGASMPLASNDNAAGRQQNRRVELLFSDTTGRFASNEAGQALR